MNTVDTIESEDEIMRTLAVTQNITLDGVIDMSGGWATPSGKTHIDETEQVAALQRQAAASDAFLVGRQTFTDMRGYWPNVENDETGNTAHLNDVAKYVVSQTLTDPQWQNSTVLSGPVADEVAALKAAPGRDIVVTGSISLAHELIRLDLVDEYRLFVYPAVAGRGRRLFEGEGAAASLWLRESAAFANGVVLSVYGVDRADR